MNSKPNILLTGASGHIGQVFLRYYGDQYVMRLAYNTHPIDAPSGHEAIRMDLTQFDQVLAAASGMQAIVHMGADSRGRAPWESVLQNNIVGTYNVYEAARQAGVDRVVYASSNHAAGYAVRDEGIPVTGAPIRPDSLYGVSKCFGESLGRYYHDHHGLGVICLRIGSCHQLDDPDAERKRMQAAVSRASSFPYVGRQYAAMWISNRDMAQLIHRSLVTERSYGIYYGISDNDPPMFDLTGALEELGYEPQDDVSQFL
jgi:nucleoside-diphosphate-sugar epimerase